MQYRTWKKLDAAVRRWDVQDGVRKSYEKSQRHGKEFRIQLECTQHEPGPQNRETASCETQPCHGARAQLGRPLGRTEAEKFPVSGTTEGVCQARRVRYGRHAIKGHGRATLRTRIWTSRQQGP